jgi:hypothetical protein
VQWLGCCMRWSLIAAAMKQVCRTGPGPARSLRGHHKGVSTSGWRAQSVVATPYRYEVLWMWSRKELIEKRARFWLVIAGGLTLQAVCDAVGVDR